MLPPVFHEFRNSFVVNLKLTIHLIPAVSSIISSASGEGAGVPGRKRTAMWKIRLACSVLCLSSFLLASAQERVPSAEPDRSATGPTSDDQAKPADPAPKPSVQIVG
ncbi:MAG: hypothetical protein ABIG68_00350, partial [Acidobacteriota bacterium]